MMRMFKKLRGKKKKTEWGRCPKCDSILLVDKRKTESNEKKYNVNDEESETKELKTEPGIDTTMVEIRLVNTDASVEQSAGPRNANVSAAEVNPKDTFHGVIARESPSEQDTLFNLSISSEIASSSYQMGLMTLPTEILFKIIMHIPQDRSLVALKSTCSFFHLLLENERVWNRRTLHVQVDVHWSVIDRVLTSTQLLSSINLSGCTGVTDNLIAFIVRAHRELKHVNISGCVLVSDRSLTELELSVTALEFLDLSRCCLVTCGGIFRLLRKHSSTLRSLNMNECLGMAYDPYRVSRMAQFCLNLNHLSFGWSRRAVGLSPILDMDVGKFAVMCPNLTSLEVSCSNLNDSGVDVLARNCRGLQYLALRHSCIKDSGLFIIASTLKHLRRLDLSDCSYLTDKGMQAISTMLQSLQVLNISRCFNVTDNGMALVLSSLSILKELYISGCFRITDRGMENAGVYCKKLYYIDMSSTLVSCRAVQALKEVVGVALQVITTNCPLVQYASLARDVVADSTIWPPSLIENSRQWT